MTRRRLQVRVRGVVQGVGFRPFVYTTAVALGLSGSVRNDTSGAIIEVEGDGSDIDDFLTRLDECSPPLAVIESVDTKPVPVIGGTGFTIADSSRSDGGRTLASPDVAMCAECAAEQRDPANRRYRHAFVNCTNCGPRFTIIASLPYDRSSTTMAGFAMCADCAREYADPADRRFHAQPVCCPNCGPTLRYRDVGGRATEGDAGLHAARALLKAGGVLAVKGIGGYQLGLRRRRRAGGRRTAATEAPGRQAIRGDGARSDRSARHRDRRRRFRAPAVGPAAPDRADAAATRRLDRRCRRPAQPRPRRHDGLHAAARAPLRYWRATNRGRRCW